MIPSIGADFGKAMDQVEMLRDHPFPTAMILPMRFPSTPKGVAVGVAKIAARYGKPLILYIKDDGYIAPMDCAALIKDGAVTVIKYGTVRQHPADDPFLGELTGAVDPMRIISGIGERPVIEHFSSFGLRAFTSGCVCIAPRLSMLIREHLLAGRHDAAAALRQEFLRMEDLRDTYSPLRVLHQAVGLAGICETGPMQPFLSDIDDADALSAIKSGAQALRAKELAARQRHAA